MEKSWFLVGVFMGWDTGFKCVSTEKWCFSYITLHPLGVIHNTTGFILLKPRPTRRTFSGWKRTCRSWEVTYWVWPTSQLASPTGFWVGEKTNCEPSRSWIRGEAYLLSPFRQRRGGAQPCVARSWGQGGAAAPRHEGRGCCREGWFGSGTPRPLLHMQCSGARPG